MLRNLGRPDRIIRMFLGAVLMLAPFVVPLPLWVAGWTVWAAVIIGFILAATALVGFCPIYAALRLSTANNSGEKK